MGKTILIVDDDDEIREALAELLTMKGWEVKSVSSAEKGTILLFGLCVDIVLSDMEMPQMNGIEFYNLVVKELETPFILMSGAGESVSELAKENGIPFIEKPLNLKELINTLLLFAKAA